MDIASINGMSGQTELTAGVLIAMGLAPVSCSVQSSRGCNTLLVSVGWFIEFCVGINRVVYRISDEMRFCRYGQISPTLL
jgi:hypothetical protein